MSRQNDADGGFTRADAAIGNRPGLRFLLALILLSLAAFAAAFRASLTWWYRQVFAASNVVEAITGLPWWLRLLMPLAGGLAAGVLSRLRGAPNQGVSNVMEAVVLGTIQLRVRDDGARGCIMDRHRNPHVHRSGRTSPRIRGTIGSPASGDCGDGDRDTRDARNCGPRPNLRPTRLRVPVWQDLAWFGALGVIAVAAALSFRRVLASMEDWAERHQLPQPLQATLGSGLVGIIAAIVPAVAGNRYEPLNAILDHG